ncbi:MAG TPA: 3-deoxy-7-phosphoheptulonate synthase [Candidatus Polarisedimenticolaceae bacterium]|nr:3-deoxy-7-phosphoheptulonate synthase [Candidatus Polarisedimenticolaceae bacterium]
MLIVMKKGSRREDLARVVRTVESLGFVPHVVEAAGKITVGISGNPGPLNPALFESHPGVARAIPITEPLKLAARNASPEGTSVRVGSRAIGDGGVFVIAGPCAVEGDHLVETARLLRAAGADALRGGAFKARTSPYSFQGMGRPGLELLVAAKRESGLPIVSEAVDEATLDLLAPVADMIQIGSRNMHNYELLKLAGRLKKPVLLKRGMAATLDELLLAAEYVLAAGNPDVVLCERGIRTFSQHSRFTLDLSIVPAVRELSHLPVVVDPSHATGRRERVPAMARAAVAAGADGVMIEVHPAPDQALSDAQQAVPLSQAAELIAQLREIAAIARPRTEAVR